MCVYVWGCGNIPTRDIGVGGYFLIGTSIATCGSGKSVQMSLDIFLLIGTVTPSCIDI